MTPTERVGFFAFLAVTVTIFIAFAGVLIRMALERAGKLTAPLSRRTTLARRAILVLGTLGVLCVLYGLFVEPYWPEVTMVRIPTAKLARGSRPIRILHVSDIHSDSRARLEDRLPTLAATMIPDAIVFSGDAINGPEGLENFRRCMAGLAAVAPTFAVRGNWDSWFWNRIDLYQGTGVTELDGDGRELVVGDSRVWICGVGVEHESRIDRAFAGAPPETAAIFLYHYPDEIYTVASQYHPDLYCAGHTHGGQVALPLYGAILTFSRFGKRFEAGLYRVESTWLYVNRGIGMEGGDMPRVRFYARPEVTVYELVPEG